ncbi:MAG: hypothetical protein HFI45_07210 [Lachnospiraceae bacterium]|nr:hypothetical protein [Lachnospiraceae bacterium]
MGKIAWRPQLTQSLKIAAAAFLAIAVSGELGLKYSATAGIITVLSIQNTKMETLKSAGRRWLAFLCALAISGACFFLMGYNLWAFGGYLFLFALLCLSAGWGQAIAMDSVLVSHFLIERNMGLGMLANEALLLLAGTGLGILINLHLRKKESEFQRLSGEVDSQMKGILREISGWLLQGGQCGIARKDSFKRLRAAIAQAKACAVSNYDNTFFSKSGYELDYISMREEQSILLQEICNNIVRIQYLPLQAKQVAELLGRIGEDFHQDNTVEGLLREQEEQLKQMKEQPLPVSREEFEARAILFYILMQTRQFLELKRDFALMEKNANFLLPKA